MQVKFSTFCSLKKLVVENFYPNWKSKGLSNTVPEIAVDSPLCSRDSCRSGKWDLNMELKVLGQILCIESQVGNIPPDLTNLWELIGNRSKSMEYSVSSQLLLVKLGKFPFPFRERNQKVIWPVSSSSVVPLLPFLPTLNPRSVTIVSPLTNNSTSLLFSPFIKLTCHNL